MFLRDRGFVQHFVSAGYALDDLRKRRLKVSFLEDMNDPFELLGGSLNRPEDRRVFRAWKADMNHLCRVLCFSRSWSNPVLWSHYADKHCGYVLGFDVPDQFIIPVSYAAKRLEMQLEKLLAKGSVKNDLSLKLMTTKFADWRYEDEVRMFAKPEETYEEQGMHFHEFNVNLKLREVVIGPRAAMDTREVEAAIQTIDKPVKITVSRLAFRSFRVVPNDVPIGISS